MYIVTVEICTAETGCHEIYDFYGPFHSKINAEIWINDMRTSGIIKNEILKFLNLPEDELLDICMEVHSITSPREVVNG